MPSLLPVEDSPASDIYTALSSKMNNVDWESSRDVGAVLHCIKFALDMGNLMDGHVDRHQCTKYIGA